MSVGGYFIRKCQRKSQASPQSLGAKCELNDLSLILREETKDARLHFAWIRPSNAHDTDNQRTPVHSSPRVWNEAKSKGKWRLPENTRDRKESTFSSREYLFRLPFGVSITTVSSPGSRSNCWSLEHGFPCERINGATRRQNGAIKKSRPVQQTETIVNCRP